MASLSRRPFRNAREMPIIKHRAMLSLRVFAIVLGVSVWGALMAWFLTKSMQFEATPGAQASHPPLSVVSADSWRLVLIVTDKCPCSVASVSALRSMVDLYPQSTTATVVFVGLTAKGSREYESAAAMGSIQVELDPRGESLAKYGAKTSGQAFVYDPGGSLVYSGGLTNARGVDEPGFAVALYKSIRAGGKLPIVEPVFGCSLKGVAQAP